MRRRPWSAVDGTVPRAAPRLDRALRQFEPAAGTGAEWRDHRHHAARRASGPTRAVRERPGPQPRTRIRARTAALPGTEAAQGSQREAPDRGRSRVSMLVLDSSIAMSWCFADQGTDYARSVLEALLDGCAVVPELWFLEVAHVAGLAEQRDILPAADRIRFLDLLGGLR